MPKLEIRTAVPASAQQLFDWHARPRALERLNPPFAPVKVIERVGSGIDVGTRVSVVVSWGPIEQTWVAEHTALEPGRMFRDEQRRGPFSRWVHTHRFVDGELADEVEWESPLGLLHKPVASTLDRLFRYRHQLTLADLIRHQRFRSLPRMCIAITGASGLIGSAALAYFDTAGHEVRPIRRGDFSALAGCDAVIHLAGAPIGQRWTPASRVEIVRSRVEYTRALVAAMRSCRPVPRVLLAGSAIGIYADRADEVLTESSPLGQRADRGAGFLAALCSDWEAEALAAQDFARVVLMRTGVVLSPHGGALAQMLPAFRWGGGGPLGSGRQWMSTVSLEDQLGAMEHALFTESLTGPVNFVGPQPLTGAQFAQTLGGVLRRPALLAVPPVALRALFGEAADAAFLASQRVHPERLLASGFQFLHPTVEAGLRFGLGLA